jgi:SAM-dependent methyltransferase
VADEIVSGTLECRNGDHRFPIEWGVPNMLREPVPNERMSHFGEQWNWYLSGKFENPDASTYGEDRGFILQDFWEMTGLTPESLPGKRILDVGSGSSKIAFHLTRAFPGVQFQIVCLEVTDAVYAASRRVSDVRAPHIRASAFHPGLRCESFDIVYCAGVLHHTPDPRKAFSAIVPLARPGGIVSTWMYSKRFNPFLDTTGLIWPATRRLPIGVVLALAYVMSPFFWVLFRAGCVYKAVFKPRSWRWKWVLPMKLASIRLHLFDYMHTYYRFRYWPGEIVSWYQALGLIGITLLRPGSTAMYAHRPIDQAAKSSEVSSGSHLYLSENAGT